MQKVVINSCFGGFGMSALGVKKYCELEGKECYFFEYDFTAKKLTQLSLEDTYKKLSFQTFTVPNPEEYGDNKYDYCLQVDEIPRDNESLIRVVEELGDYVNSPFSDLTVVEIPDGVSWGIEEYDGNEHIAEEHRTWGN